MVKVLSCGGHGGPGSLRPRACRDPALLGDGLQHLTLDSLCDESQLLAQSLIAVAHTDVRHVRTADIIALGALLGIVGSQPVALHLQWAGVSDRAAASFEGPRPRPEPSQGQHPWHLPKRRGEERVDTRLQAGGGGTLWEKPLMSTLLRASSHMSQELSFHTCVAMLYSSISGSCAGQVPSDGCTRPCHPVSAHLSLRAPPFSAGWQDLPQDVLHSTSRGQHQRRAPGAWVSWASQDHQPPGSDLGEVELQGIISGQGDHEPAGQVLGERVPVVAEEEAVVAERRHGDANLGQVIQVLQDGGLRGQRGGACQAASRLGRSPGSGGVQATVERAGSPASASRTEGHLQPRSKRGSQCGGRAVQGSKLGVW